MTPPWTIVTAVVVRIVALPRGERAKIRKSTGSSRSPLAATARRICTRPLRGVTETSTATAVSAAKFLYCAKAMPRRLRPRRARAAFWKREPMARKK